MKDFYLVLQVAPNATPEEIRAAYRCRALKLHPDHSGADSEPFIELQNAYSVLSDPSQRAAYDRRSEAIPVRRVARRETSRRPRAEPFRDPDLLGGSAFEDLFEWLWSR